MKNETELNKPTAPPVGSSALLGRWHDWRVVEPKLRSIGIFKKRSPLFSKLLSSGQGIGSFLFECDSASGTGQVRVLFKPSNGLTTLTPTLWAFDGKKLSVGKLAHNILNRPNAQAEARRLDGVNQKQDGAPPLPPAQG